jgi:hypothetical protein
MPIESSHRRSFRLRRLGQRDPARERRAACRDAAGRSPIVFSIGVGAISPSNDGRLDPVEAVLHIPILAVIDQQLELFGLV